MPSIIKKIDITFECEYCKKDVEIKNFDMLNYCYTCDNGYHSNTAFEFCCPHCKKWQIAYFW